MSEPLAAAARSRLLRPPARAVDALLHRDVGALQLLRHARVPHPLHDGPGGGGRAGLRRRATPRRFTAPTPAARGARRSSAALVADRLLGQYRSVLLGGIIIAAGHFTLAFKALPFFYTGLGLIVVGTGLLKPNVSTLVGSLYAPGDARRDAGFSLFYMGINLGAFIGPLVAGYLAQRVDWHIGFASAGIGMTFGLVAVRARPQAAARPAMTRLDRTPAPRRRHRARRPPTASGGFTAAEWKRIGAIVIFFLVAVLFWGAYEQAGSTLNLFADRYTRLEVFGFSFPSSWFQSVQPIFVILLAPAFAWLWLRLGRARAVGAGEVRDRPAVHGPLVPRPRPGRRDGAERRRHARQPVVARRVVCRLGARRAVPQPGRPQRRHQARAAAHRRPDDGRVVPVERVRQQARRLGRGLLQHDAAATRSSRSSPPC